MFVRENSMAVLAALALCLGDLAFFMPKAIFWHGHITNHTLKAIIVPNHIPIPIAVCPISLPIPSMNASRKYPFTDARMTPVTIVDRAAHLNQKRALGAMTFATAGFCSSGIFGIAGICTKLKYHNKPIHITPLTTCNQRKMKLTYCGVSPPISPRYASINASNTSRMKPAPIVLFSDESIADISLPVVICLV